MIAAIAPDFVAQNAPPPSRNPSTAMPCAAPTVAEIPPGFSDARARIEEIEQLYTAGLSTYDIADALTLRPRDVGRNLREIRKRHQRVARRAEILAVGQCAAIQREAMEGWRRSQEPKLAVTTRRKSGEPDVVTTRTENRPGNCAFLNTALRAMKQLRQIAAEAPAEPRKASDAARLALLEVLTPAQAAAFTPDQVQQFRTALDRWSTVLNAVNDELHATDAGTQESPVPEHAVEAQPAETQPARDVAAVENEQTAPIAQDRRQLSARPAVSRPRHPEWPAESFLTRSWLPPDQEFAANGRENGARPTETGHERNGHAVGCVKPSANGKPLPNPQERP